MIYAQNLLQKETSARPLRGVSVVDSDDCRTMTNPSENCMTLLFLFYILFSKGAGKAAMRRGGYTHEGGDFHIGGHAIPYSAAGHHPPALRPSLCGRGVLVGAFTTNPTDRPAAPATTPVFVISSRATLEPRGTLQRTRRSATRDEHVRTDYVYILLF